MNIIKPKFCLTMHLIAQSILQTSMRLAGGWLLTATHSGKIKVKTQSFICLLQATA